MKGPNFRLTSLKFWVHHSHVELMLIQGRNIVCTKMGNNDKIYLNKTKKPYIINKYTENPRVLELED